MTKTQQANCTEPMVIGRCQHCNVQQFDNPDADLALDAMVNLCWKCVKPWQVNK